MRILDYGAGEGTAFRDPERAVLYDLRPLGEVWACDVDPIVSQHPGAHHHVLIEENQSLPFEDGQFDLIVSDVVFEHIRQPDRVTPELMRVLRPGGVICARTPNSFGYPALATRMIPNRLHSAALRVIQPERRSEDVFPTVFRLNRPSAIRKAFPGCAVSWYGDSGEPAYYFGNRLLYGILAGLHRILPETLATSFCFFIEKPNLR